MIQTVSFLKLCRNGTSRSFISSVSYVHFKKDKFILYIRCSIVENSNEREYDDEHDERDVMKEKAKKKKKGKWKKTSLLGDLCIACATNTFTQNCNGGLFECIDVDKFSNLNPYTTGFFYPPLHIRIYAHAHKHIASRYHHHQTTENDHGSIEKP